MSHPIQQHRLSLALGLVLSLAACHTARNDAAGLSPPRQPMGVQETDNSASAAAATAQMQLNSTVERTKARQANARAEAAALAPRVPPAHPVAAPAPSQMGYASSTYVLAPKMAMPQPANTEKYAAHEDNAVQRTSEQPVSTFSIDVDTGSYSNVRRMLVGGVRPPSDSVRAEEFINYFDYNHPAPTSRKTPFRVSTELAPAPWNGKRQLLMIGIKGYDVPKATLPPANLVFLIDTSGSMQSPDKLPLVKDSLRQLVKRLRPQDRVSIVVYAGSAGLVLPPTSGADHERILAALDRLEAGGSTNGGAGIALAYAMAKRAFVNGGINRVILATDGDFNVGTVDQNALETMVADQRKTGIALTTLGFGQGNYNDHLAERLADVGDGNHAYIDTPREARKVLVEEMGATLLTIARDVKIQIEFNPAAVSEYRLIGYENRVLEREDFANDKVDAGDIGAGHEVTALYEITLVGSDAQRLPPLRYGVPATPAGKDAPGARSELAHLRLRYKRPGEEVSQLIQTPILRSQLAVSPSESMRFASAVAAFADTLRGGKHVGHWSWREIATAARDSLGEDPWGQRRELVDLIEQARKLTSAGEVATAEISR